MKSHFGDVFTSINSIRLIHPIHAAANTNICASGRLHRSIPYRKNIFYYKKPRHRVRVGLEPDTWASIEENEHLIQADGTRVVHEKSPEGKGVSGKSDRDALILRFVKSTDARAGQGLKMYGLG